MRISIFVTSLVSVGCTIQHHMSNSHISDMFPTVTVVFPTDEVFAMSWDKENELMIYDSDMNKWYAGQVTKLLDSHKVDYVVR